MTMQILVYINICGWGVNTFADTYCSLRSQQLCNNKQQHHIWDLVWLHLLFFLFSPLLRMAERLSAGGAEGRRGGVAVDGWRRGELAKGRRGGGVEERRDGGVGAREAEGRGN